MPDGVAEPLATGVIADNIIGFARALRAAGMPVGPGATIDALKALQVVGLGNRADVFTALESVFVKRHEHAAIFAQAFEIFFRAVQNWDQLVDAVPLPGQPEQKPPPPASRRVQEAFAQRDMVRERESYAQEMHLSVSDEEVLQTKDFAQMSAAEIAEVTRAIERMKLPLAERPTRRFQPLRQGRKLDLRRTLRGSLRTGGEPTRLAHRRRRVVRRRVVLLCDISGSMEPYARAYLQFLTCAGRDAEAFVFATRLTRITRALATRSPERAIQRAAAAAPDWSSGTRIGEALKHFNDRHGRRGMARGAVIVILSDGWERGEPALVAREMERLSRLAYRIVWVNPRAASASFQPRVGGMAAALPFIDALVSGHSLEALGEVAGAIAAERSGKLQALEPEEDPEPWASATPVAGSSVAMPSGYGPSRGRTTPGW